MHASWNVLHMPGTLRQAVTVPVAVSEAASSVGMATGQMGQMPATMAEPRPGPVQASQALRVCLHWLAFVAHHIHLCLPGRMSDESQLAPQPRL